MDGCYFTSWCGDRVRFVRYETYWFCCSVNASWCNNCFGLSGPQDGQPNPPYLETVACCLEQGTAEQLADSINAARAKWLERVGSADPDSSV